MTAKPRHKQRVSSVDGQISIFECITEDECRSLVRRVINRLNKAIFRSARRRRNNRQRINALVCLHNKGTRFHIHMLFGVPPHITLDAFETLFDDAVAKERFVYDERKVTPIDKLTRAVIYNANPSKNQTGDPIIYQSWQGITEGKTNEENEEDGNYLGAAVA